MATINRKRKYNASHRLRKKLGGVNFPTRSRIIYSEIDKDLTTISEVKILIKEYGFIVQPLLFTI